MKNVFILALMLCMSCKAFAVSRDSLPLNAGDRQFVGGIISGGNICDIIHDYYPGYHKVGLNAGLMVYAKLRNILWLQMELLYSQKGCIGVREVSSVAWGEYFEKYYLRLNYVEVPILINAFIRPTWHLCLGGSYSYLVNESEKLYSDQPYYIDPLQYYSRKMSVDYILGGGIHLGRKVYLNIRYQRSLLPVRTTEHVYPLVGYSSYYNQSATMQLLYMFR